MTISQSDHNLTGFQWAGLTRLELLVVFSVLGLLISLLLPSGRTDRELSEEELGLTTDWTPGPEQGHEPAESLLISDAQIVGEWKMSGVFIKISRNSPGRYDVEFNTYRPCVGCTLQRTATYREGIIELDQPVKALNGPAYKRLFTVKWEGTEHLLPAPHVTEFELHATEFLDNGQFPSIALSRWRGPFGDE